MGVTPSSNVGGVGVTGGPQVPINEEWLIDNFLMFSLSFGVGLLAFGVHGRAIVKAVLSAIVLLIIVRLPIPGPYGTLIRTSLALLGVGGLVIQAANRYRR
jgi:hypothetical protein